MVLQVSWLRIDFEQTCTRQVILARSLNGGGETGRLVSKKMKQSHRKNEGVADGYCDEYPGYARFVEEATIGYSAMQVRMRPWFMIALPLCLIAVCVADFATQQSIFRSLP